MHPSDQSVARIGTSSVITGQTCNPTNIAKCTLAYQPVEPDSLVNTPKPHRCDRGKGNHLVGTQSELTSLICISRIWHAQLGME